MSGPDTVALLFFRKGNNVMDTIDIPVWEKYVLSIKEAAAYFGIGENKLRNLISQNRYADYIFWNGNRAQIKRRKFEDYVDDLETI